jgi:hypothetical protein
VDLSPVVNNTKQPLWKMSLTGLLFILPFLLQCTQISGSDGNSQHQLHRQHNHSLLDGGKCKNHVWRIDAGAGLPGKCVGINPTREFEDLEHLVISNWHECRALCCNLNERCTTWQYQNKTKTCFLHRKPFRRGPEGAATALYCDPHPTHAWNGKFLHKRTVTVPHLKGGENKKTYECQWEYNLPAQCFAFGPERLNNSGVISMEKGVRMNTEECERACCHDPDCNSYQEYPGRGCYYGVSTCKYEEVEGGFEGGRKCLPGFCGGLEKEVLLPNQFVELEKLAERLKQD